MRRAGPRRPVRQNDFFPDVPDEDVDVVNGQRANLFMGLSMMLLRQLKVTQGGLGPLWVTGSARDRSVTE